MSVAASAPAKKQPAAAAAPAVSFHDLALGAAVEGVVAVAVVVDVVVVAVVVPSAGPKSPRTAETRINPASPCGSVLSTYTVRTSRMLVCAASPGNVLSSHTMHPLLRITSCVLVVQRQLAETCQAIQTTTVITSCMLVCATSPCGNLLSSYAVHCCYSILHSCAVSVCAASHWGFAFSCNGYYQQLYL